MADIYFRLIVSHNCGMNTHKMLVTIVQCEEIPLI